MQYKAPNCSKNQTIDNQSAFDSAKLSMGQKLRNYSYLITQNGNNTQPLDGSPCEGCGCHEVQFSEWIASKELGAHFREAHCARCGRLLGVVWE